MIIDSRPYMGIGRRVVPGPSLLEPIHAPCCFLKYEMASLHSELG
jgi:hypothetical protein